MASPIEQPQEVALDLTDTFPIHPDIAGKDKKERIRKKVEQAFRSYKRQRADIEQVWDYSHDAYHAVPPTEGPYQNRFVDREVFRQVEALKPLMSDLLLPAEGDWFKYLPTNSNDEDAAVAATKIVEKHLDRHDLVPEIQKWLDESFLWGVSYLQYGWRKYKSNTRRIMRLDQEEGHTEKRETDEVLHGAPFVKWLDHRSVYTDPNIENLEDSPYVFIHRKVSAAHLRTQQREGLYDQKEVSAVLKQGGTPDSDDDTDRTEELLMPDDTLYNELTCYTNNGWVYVFVGDTMVHGGYNVHGVVPILCLQNYKPAGKHYGQGEPETLAGENAMLQDMSRLYMDSLSMNLMPMQKCAKSEKNNMRRVKHEPRAIWYLDDPSKIEPVVGNSAQVMDLASAISMHTRKMQLTNGLPEELTGGGSSQDTATGMMRLQEAASMRVKHRVKMYVFVFKKLWRKFYELEATYLDEDVAIAMAGSGAREMLSTADASSFEPTVDVEVIVAPTMESKQGQQSRLQVLWGLAGQDPRFNLKQIAYELLRTHGIRDPKSCWADPLQTQNDVMKTLAEFQTTGYMEPALPFDNHQMWFQMLSMFMQTAEFAQMDEFSQTIARGRMQEHLQYLGADAMTAGQVSQQAMNPGNNEVIPGQESATNAETGSRMAGANQQPGGGDAAIERGTF